MNWAKINQEVVKALVNGLKWGELPHCWINDGEYIMVTLDGFAGYFIPKDKVKFVVEGKEINKPFERSSNVIVPENEIRPTNTYVKAGYNQRYFMRMFKGVESGKTWKTYVDEKMLKPLEREGNVKFYQFDKFKEPNVRPILAADDDVPLMLLMPVRVDEDSEFD